MSPIKTRCIRDHDLTDPANVYVYVVDGAVRLRACIPCRRLQRQKRRDASCPTDRKSPPDAKVLARLLDAHRDGVSGLDLMERFEGSARQVETWIQLAKDNEGQGVAR